MSLVVDGFASGVVKVVSPLAPPRPVQLTPYGDGFDGDVFLFQTLDAGDIELNDGQPFMTGGFETAAYLSLFGGADWWANLTEPDALARYTARTEKLLQGLPNAPSNLRAIEQAATLDLTWLIEAGTARSVLVVASIPKPGWLALYILVVSTDGTETDFTFVENWAAMRTQHNGT